MELVLNQYYQILSSRRNSSIYIFLGLEIKLNGYSQFTFTYLLLRFLQFKTKIIFEKTLSFVIVKETNVNINQGLCVRFVGYNIPDSSANRVDSTVRKRDL